MNVLKVPINVNKMYIHILYFLNKIKMHRISVHEIQIKSKFVFITSIIYDTTNCKRFEVLV